MKKPKFSLADYKTPEIVALINGKNHKVLAVWAIECALRVLPYFETEYPQDKRPRTALETLQQWIDTGEFKMSIIRTASLDSHAAAKEIGNDSPAASAAHAAGQAVATAHVPLHALGSANYALQALYRDAKAEDFEHILRNERAWQMERLRVLEGGWVT